MLGLGLRLIQGPDHFIWDWDQARDSFVAPQIISERDLILVGPQAEIYGLFHGPLFYYLIAPAYYFFATPRAALGLMILLNLATLIPLYLLTKNAFHSSAVSLLSLLLFAVSYEQIGYARWISNVSITIPFIVWIYYLLWKHTSNKKVSLWISLIAGFLTGCAVQGQLFLLYLVPIAFFVFYTQHRRIKHYLIFSGGLITGLLPQIIFEIKYGFQGVKLFVSQFIVQEGKSPVLAGQVFSKYLTHMGMVVKDSLSGFSDGFGLYVLGIMGVIVFWQYAEFNHRQQRVVKLLLLWLFSHAILFAFHFVDAVFLDLGIGVSVIILAAFLLTHLWESGYRFAVAAATAFFVSSQLFLLWGNTTAYTPFSSYNFAQTGITFEQKLEIVDLIYQQLPSQTFSVGVFGNPYGVRTVWASVFAEYQRRTGAMMPAWYGYYANGYPGEALLQPQDYPEQTHVLVIEPTLELHSPYIRDQYMENINESTTLDSEQQIYGYTIQIRHPRQPVSTH